MLILLSQKTVYGIVNAYKSMQNKMMNKSQVCVFFGIAKLCYVALADDRFTYESLLLEKMIRMEIKMESMEKRVNKSQERMEATVQYVTNFVENKTEELMLLEERVDMPLVAFNVYSPVDTSLDTDQIVIWQSIRLNEGNGYDNVIGVFTAPVGGVYFFSVHVCNYSGRFFLYVLLLDHDTIAGSYKHDNANYDCGTVNSVVKIREGQRVWVKCTSGNANPQIYESYGQSSFIGILMHK